MMFQEMGKNFDKVRKEGDLLDGKAVHCIVSRLK